MIELENIKPELVRNQLDVIFYTQLERVFALTSDFSQHFGKFIDFIALPLATIEHSESSLQNLLFEDARLNSIRSKDPHSSFFTDTYNRSGEAQTKFNLISKTCLLSNDDTSTIAIVPSMYDLAHSLFIKMSETTKHNNAVQIIFSKQEEVYFFTFPKIWKSFVWRGIGSLAIFPNRDWQLARYIKQFSNGAEIRSHYQQHKSHLISNFPSQLTSINLDLDNPLLLFNKINQQLLNLSQCYENNIYVEQRYFYIHLLIQFINRISGIAQTNSIQLQPQLTLSLFRLLRLIDALMQQTIYSCFLQTIEIIIDEINLCSLILTSENPLLATEVKQQATEFIQQSSQAKPQHASLRTSGMHAIWTCFQVSLKHYQLSRNDVYLSYDNCIYFEVKQIIIPLSDCSEEHNTNFRFNLHTFQGKPSDPSDGIFHIYLANFESNVQENYDEQQYTDIGHFIKSQLNKRLSLNLKDSLIIIIDNTISDYTAVHVAQLITDFKTAIDEGRLCILVCHSGNKYFSLGLDKQPASLIYGFYNPQHFSAIENFFQHDIDANRLGDLKPSSPTVLLTYTFLSCAREQIMSYSVMIRQRTAWLFKHIVPKELHGSTPFYIDRRSKLIISNFISIKFKNPQCWVDVNRLFQKLEFNKRSGFGFSQTTVTEIRGLESLYIFRLSVGTEALDTLAEKLNLLCDFLLLVNHITLHQDIRHEAVLPQVRSHVCNYFKKSPGYSGNLNTFFSPAKLKREREELLNSYYEQHAPPEPLSRQNP